MNSTATKKTFREYFYFLFGQQFSILGSMIVYFVITWWLTIETQSAVVLSISAFLLFIPQIVVTPIAGVLADRLKRKNIIIIVDSLQAGISFGLFFLFFFGITFVWLIMIVNTLRSVLQAFHTPTFYAIVPSMVPKEKLSRINGINYLFGGIMNITGPLIAALLYEFIEIQLIFLLDICTFLIAVIPLVLITIPKVRSPEKEEKAEKSFRKDFFKGLAIIKAIPGLMSMIIMATIWNFVFRPFAVLMPYYVSVFHSGTALDLAVVTAFMQAGNITGALITTLKKTWKHKIKINLIGVVGFFGAYLLVIFAPMGGFWFMGIGTMIAGTILPVTVALYLTILQTEVPQDKIGRVMSIDHMISMAIAPLGALFAGPMADLIGIQTLFLGCSIIGMFFPLVLWFFTKIRALDEEKLEETLEVELEVRDLTKTESEIVP